ncbi:MAG: hypothetical protein JW881_19975 [Spirochaetales bacterium]|nr:hypothetical protein [Spirochaetales bacterium]
MKNIGKIADILSHSDNPSIRWKIRVHFFNEDPDSKAIKKISREVTNSPNVKLLLQNQSESGKIKSGHGVYDKWQGAHWILASLSDIGYPPGDPSLVSAKNAILSTWLAPSYYREFEAKSKQDAYREQGVPVMEGRYRRCASQQGYALHYLIVLGLFDDRLHDLAERLMHWQWPDGGWNCDKRPQASTSSFIETAIPMRGLYRYAETFKDEKAKSSALRASELFLKRRLFKRLATGEIIDREFVRLHYPLYWHYDILGMLKILSEMNLVGDKRCADALELLTSKFIPGTGWPAEKKYYRTSHEIKPGNDYVDWGGTGKRKANDWVTADALCVLKKAEYI